MSTSQKASVKARRRICACGCSSKACSGVKTMSCIKVSKANVSQHSRYQDVGCRMHRCFGSVMEAAVVTLALSEQVTLPEGVCFSFEGMRSANDTSFG